MRDRLIIGWCEWLSLPDLDLPFVEAKVDTGTETSALHVFAIDEFEENGRHRVCFGTHPLADNTSLEVFACADLVDVREIVSSNGQVELRPVIKSILNIADKAVSIELTLTNRASMRYRMLLGRKAIQALNALVDPTEIHLMGRAVDPERAYAKSE